MWQIPTRFQAEVDRVPSPLAGGLPPRLAAVAVLVPGAAKWVADVGADHGLLSLELLRTVPDRRVLAIDLSAATQPAARATLRAAIAAGRAACLQGDGLDGVLPGRLDAVVLAGVGGRTVKSVLTRALAQDQSPGSIVVQAQFGHAEIRQRLMDAGYGLLAETLVADRQRLYLTMAFGRGQVGRPLTSDLDRCVGPWLTDLDSTPGTLLRAWCGARLDWLAGLPGARDEAGPIGELAVRLGLDPDSPGGGRP